MDKEAELAAAIQKTKWSYDKIGAIFEAGTTAISEKFLYPKILSLLADHFGSMENAAALDLGCGGGRLMERLREKGAKPIGIDISSELLKMARKKSLDVIQGSIHQLPFPNESFDIVVSNFTLLYLPPDGQEKTLKEVYRVLKRGGVFVYSTKHPFFMRMGYYNPETQKYASITDDYFKPKSLHSWPVGPEKLEAYLLDWPEIVNMLIRNNFLPKEMVDAPNVPETLEEIARKTPDEAHANMLRGFKKNPFVIFAAAQKP